MAMMFVGIVVILFSIGFVTNGMQWNCRPINFCTYTEMTLNGQSYEESESLDCLPNGDLRKREFNNRYCSGIVTNTTTTSVADLRVPCGECTTYGIAEANIYYGTGGCTGTAIGTVVYAGPIGCDGEEGELTQCSAQGLFHTHYANGDCTGAVVNETSDEVGKCEALDNGMYLEFSTLSCYSAEPTTSPTNKPTDSPITSTPTSSPTTETPTSVTQAPTTYAPTAGTDAPTSEVVTKISEDVDDRNDAYRIGRNWTYFVVIWTALCILQ